MTKTKKATKATIQLGDIELDVFQLPDGEYIFSKSQVVNSVKTDKKRLSEILETKALQKHMPQGLRLSYKVKY